MKRFQCTIVVVLIAGSFLVGPADADPRPIRMDGTSSIHHGAPTAAKATRADSLHLIGDPLNPDHAGPGGVLPQVTGTFEDASGQPDWNGWTHADESVQFELYWQISDFMAPSGQYAYWCGTHFDGDPGYGNDWDQRLLFTHTVDDIAATSTVEWTATMNIDVEPSYDWVYLDVWRGDDWQTLQSYSLYSPQTVSVDETIVLGGGEYGGPDGDQILLQVRFESDGAWSDWDGLFDSDGALQIDDISVTVDGMLVDFEDFEDQISQHWTPLEPVGVGDYAQLFVNLQDLDPCVSNFSAQVAFIDDGVVVPGTGGTSGITWRYGPGGYIVNNSGGPAGQGYYIDNAIISPVLQWPEGMRRALLEFDVFVHEELAEWHIWPGMFYLWDVRSTNTGDPADLDSEPWDSRHYVYYGGPEYRRHSEVISDLIAANATHAQVKLLVMQYGHVWGWWGADGTPAPYFDNVRLAVTPGHGPMIHGNSVAFFEDGFPAGGEIDLVDLGNNSVRLDAAMNIAAPAHLRNDPGDSVWFDAEAGRVGAVMLDSPRVHVRMRANHLFDPYRTLPSGFTLQPNQFDDGWSLVEGWVEADSCLHHGENGSYWVEDRWAVDLPDEGFFFPGDVIHWYVEAQDQVMGDVGTSIMPADTAGFSDFRLLSSYPFDFTVRALPTLDDNGYGQPHALVWLDAAGHGGDRAWLESLDVAGAELGRTMDLYVTNAPTAGVGNGLGGRATAVLLAEYDGIFYSSGNLTTHLMANGDHGADPSDDLGVVTAWLEQGGKKMFISGDSFVSSTLEQGTLGQSLVSTYLGVALQAHDISNLIGNQVSPRVEPVPGNGIIQHEWIANGGCPTLDQFDAVVVSNTGVRLAEFTDPNGNPDVYPYSACTLQWGSPVNATVVSIPFDLMRIEPTPGWEYTGWDHTRRDLFLDVVAEFMGFWNPTIIPGVGDDTPPAPFSVRHHPNPFNPATTFELNLPQAGPVSLKVYSVRGELVRTLIDERLTSGLHQITWDGRDDGGRAVASGVYFAETRAADQVTMSKMALVK